MLLQRRTNFFSLFFNFLFWSSITKKHWMFSRLLWSSVTKSFDINWYFFYVFHVIKDRADILLFLSDILPFESHYQSRSSGIIVDNTTCWYLWPHCVTHHILFKGYVSMFIGSEYNIHYLILALSCPDCITCSFNHSKTDVCLFSALWAGAFHGSTRNGKSFCGTLWFVSPWLYLHWLGHRETSGIHATKQEYYCDFFT